MFFDTHAPTTLEEITSYNELCAYLALLATHTAHNAGALALSGDEWHSRAPGVLLSEAGSAKHTLLVANIKTCFALTRSFPHMIEVERADLEKGYRARVHGLPALFHAQLPKDVMLLLAVKGEEKLARGLFCTNTMRCIEDKYLFEALMKPST